MSSPPTTLGQYQIIREIARSNDIVYEAYDPLMNRRVAVKELAMPGGATSQQQEERISRFRREAQAAGTLNHPNIMTVYSFAEDNGRTFMAMEYLDGGTLRNEIDTKGFLTVPRSIEIALEVLQGLEHAHSKGVIHRDIKPDNIQILSNGQVKITDFGIARLTFQPNLTMDGQVFGTPSYMSPEQVVGKEIDARSDLFSLGVMLYEMISGQKPFAGDSVVSITYAIMNKEPVQPAQADRKLWLVISKSLEKTPSMRYSSAAEMIAALQEVLNPSSPILPDPVLPLNSPYGNSPYANVLPPPVVPNSGVPVLNQPYNPYGQPTQTQGAYLQPYSPGGAVPGQTGAFPYNAPYNPTQFGNAQPQQFPIYYPPPPRGPLLNPETVIAVKKVAITFLVLGTLIALLIVCLNTVTAVADRDNRKQHDSTTISQEYMNPDAHLTIDQNIENLEKGKQMAQDDGTKARISQQLSILYQKQGKDFSDQGNMPRAEDAMQKAQENDPTNAAAISALGVSYFTRAEGESDAQEKMTLYKNAGQQFNLAAGATSNPTESAQYREYAATAYYKYAMACKDASPDDRSNIREALITARDDAPPDSDLAKSIETLLAEYR
jgi:serine/threonine-protein kinase